MKFYTFVAGTAHADNANPNGSSTAPLSVYAYRAIVYRGVASLGRSISRWRRRRTAINELSSLDDRTLMDIGVNRGEILYLADAYAAGVSQTGVEGTLENAAKTRDVLGKGIPGVASMSRWIDERLQLRARRNEERRNVRLTIRSLASLNERLLDDIGISAADVRDLKAGTLSLEGLQANRRERSARRKVVTGTTAGIDENRQQGRVASPRLPTAA